MRHSRVLPSIGRERSDRGMLHPISVRKAEALRRVDLSSGCSVSHRVTVVTVVFVGEQ